MPAADEGRRLAGPQDARVACCTCGYEWVAGQDGSHSCSRQMAGTIARLTAERDDLVRAKRTLERAGYTDNGVELWKPPLGPSASPLLERIAELEAERDALESQAGESRASYIRLAEECEELRRELRLLRPNGAAACDAGGVVTVCQRPCRCGPDGCADSGCPGRSSA